jgi:hypothetical protein
MAAAVAEHEPGMHSRWVDKMARARVAPDIKLRCMGGVEVPAHRLILQLASATMMSLLPEATDAVLPVEDFDADTWCSVLHNVYPSRYTLNRFQMNTPEMWGVDTVASYKCAHKYGFDDLLQEIKWSLTIRMDMWTDEDQLPHIPTDFATQVSTMWELLEVSQNHQWDHMFHKCLRFIKEFQDQIPELQDLSGTPRVSFMSEDTLKQIIATLVSRKRSRSPEHVYNNPMYLSSEEDDDSSPDDNNGHPVEED